MAEMKWSDGLTGLDDTNWTSCSDGTICPNKTKEGTDINQPCPCDSTVMWQPIAQSNEYTPDSSTQTCTGVINSIPEKLTRPLKPYYNGNCAADVPLAMKTHFNTSGEYCPNGIIPETNICYSSP